jgi:plastocyanin
MNSLDSRFLRLGDCFAQKFSEPGTYRYIVTAGAGSCLPAAEGEYTVVVAPGPASGAKKKEEHSSASSQQNVAVRLQEGKLVAEPAQVEVNVGAMVLWHTPDAATPGFTVIGEGPGGSFSSGALAVEAVYSHAFGAAGNYRWVDANGGSLGGEVVVERMESKQPDDCRKWVDSLKKGTLIKVVGERAEPSTVKILAGQTVFWAVERAPGISITDSRFLARKAAR